MVLEASLFKIPAGMVGRSTVVRTVFYPRIGHCSLVVERIICGVNFIQNLKIIMEKVHIIAYFGIQASSLYLSPYIELLVFWVRVVRNTQMLHVFYPSGQIAYYPNVTIILYVLFDGT